MRRCSPSGIRNIGAAVGTVELGRPSGLDHEPWFGCSPKPRHIIVGRSGFAVWALETNGEVGRFSISPQMAHTMVSAAAAFDGQRLFVGLGDGMVSVL